MDNVELYILSSRDICSRCGESTRLVWGDQSICLWLLCAVKCTPVSQHLPSVVVWLFYAVESSQLSYVTTVLHAVSRTTPKPTFLASIVRMNYSFYLEYQGLEMILKLVWVSQRFLGAFQLSFMWCCWVGLQCQQTYNRSGSGNWQAQECFNLFRDWSLWTPACVHTSVVVCLSWLIGLVACNSCISWFLPAHWWMSVLLYSYITQDCFHIFEPCGSTAS